MSTEKIMEQAQVFASAWSVVGGPFDDGDAMEVATQEKDELNRMVSRLAAERDALAAKLAELEGQYPVFAFRRRGLPDFCTCTEGRYAELAEKPHLFEVRKLYARPVPVEMSPDFTDTARAALLWVLWHHQGGSSPVGQPIRYALGMDSHEHLSKHQVQEAKRWAALTKSESNDFRQARTAPPEPVNARLTEALKRAKDSLVAFKFLPCDANRWEASDEENLAAVNSAIAAAEAAHTEPVNVDFGKRGENMFFKIGNQSFLLDYKPEEQVDFDFMKAILLSAFSRITHGVKTETQPVNVRLLEALSALLDDIEALIGESAGVYGLHLNGDVSPWSELEEGGRFERLSSMSRAREAIAAAEAQQERLLQDMHDAGREIDRVMAECFLTDWEKEQIHRQAESDAFNDLLGSLKEVCKTFSSTNRLWKDSAVQVMAQRSIARAEAALSALQPDVDGWIPWDGFHFPIQDGVAHQVRFRDGEVSEVDYEASGWPWMHDGDDSDIVAYRVVKP